MKKILLVNLILLGIFVAPNLSIAETTAEAITRILAQIQVLQAQILQLQGQNQANPWCYSFNTNLHVGHVGLDGGSRARNTTDDDVHALRQALTNQGIDTLISSYGDAYAGISIVESSFDSRTEAAVIKFQARYGIPATGYVGPLTRAKLNALYGCRIPSGNQPPVISGVSGPTTLKVGETGTWTVRASDPENGTLSYGILWGDEVIRTDSLDGMGSGPATSFSQSATLTHSYSQPGNYHPTFTVQDNSGKSVKTSLSVNVTQNAQDITVLTPNGGEQWQANSNKAIKWTWTPHPTASYSAIPKIDLYLQPVMPPCPAGMACAQVMPQKIVLDKNIANSGSYNWIVATDMVNNPIPAGNYWMEVCLADSTFSSNCDSSNQPFTITAAPTQPNITVLSPNGGEQWVSYTTQMIRWGYQNLRRSSKVDLYLDPEMPACVYSNPACMIAVRAPYTLDKNIAINGGYNWIVATDVINNPIPAGNYHLRICQAGSTTNCDSSDQAFTIVSEDDSGDLSERIMLIAKS